MNQVIGNDIFNTRHGDNGVRIWFGASRIIWQGARSERRIAQSSEARALLSRLEKVCSTEMKNQIDLSSKAGLVRKMPSDNQCTRAINLAHSGDWVAAVIATDTMVGIDVERIKKRDWDSYLENIFGVNEANWIREGTFAEQHIRQLKCWCWREAITKALGTGLIFPFSEFEFSGNGEPKRLPKVFGSVGHWHTDTQVIANEIVLVVAYGGAPGFCQTRV